MLSAVALTSATIVAGHQRPPELPKNILAQETVIGRGSANPSDIVVRAGNHCLKMTTVIGDNLAPIVKNELEVGIDQTRSIAIPHGLADPYILSTVTGCGSTEEVGLGFAPNAVAGDTLTYVNTGAPKLTADVRLSNHAKDAYGTGSCVIAKAKPGETVRQANIVALELNCDPLKNNNSYKKFGAFALVDPKGGASIQYEIVMPGTVLPANQEIMALTN